MEILYELLIAIIICTWWFFSLVFIGAYPKWGVIYCIIICVILGFWVREQKIKELERAIPHSIDWIMGDYPHTIRGPRKTEIIWAGKSPILIYKDEGVFD